MTIKIGINGFGRIGRLTFRTMNQYRKDDLEIVAINDLTDTQTNAHLLKWDSSYGRYPGKIETSEDSLIIDGKNVKVLSERDPASIPWGDYGVDIVIESTGFFTDAGKASAHLKGGAKKVIISGPATNDDVTVVLGVNEGEYVPDKHKIISNASCTTNCITPIAKVLNDNFGINKGLMTTIHAYTSDQSILDTVHKDLRRARTAAANIIPTSTGAARLVCEIIPELKGKVDGVAFRVPTAAVSVVDFVVELKQSVAVEEVNEALKKAASGPMAGILEYCEEKLVSMDFKGNPASSIVDAPGTMVIADNLIKVISWYDNEWGYSSRLADLATYIGNKGL